MDSITQSIIARYISGIAINATTAIASKIFKSAFQKKPELERQLQNVNSPQEFEDVFRQAVGVIDLKAGEGRVDMEGVFMEAAQGMRFDHQNGTVSIEKSRLASKILETGGSGHGETRIFNTNLHSKGTSIIMSGGAGIVMKGNAKIRQT